MYDWQYDHEAAIDVQDEEELPAWALPPVPVKPQPVPPNTSNVRQVAHNWTDQPQCQICLSLGRITLVKSKAVVYLSCGHVLCRNCLIADKLKACPYCRIHQERVVVSDTAKFLVLHTVNRASNEIIKKNVKEMTMDEYRQLAGSFSRSKISRPSSEVQLQFSRPTSAQRASFARLPSQPHLSRPQSAISNISSKSSLMDHFNDDWRSGSEMMNKISQYEIANKSASASVIEDGDIDVNNEDVELRSYEGSDYDEQLQVDDTGYISQSYAGSEDYGENDSLSSSPRSSSSGSQVSDLSESNSVDEINGSPSTKSLNKRSASTFSQMSKVSHRSKDVLPPDDKDYDSEGSFVAGSEGEGSYDSNISDALSVIHEDELYDDSLNGRDSSGASSSDGDYVNLSSSDDDSEDDVSSSEGGSSDVDDDEDDDDDTSSDSKTEKEGFDSKGGKLSLPQIPEYDSDNGDTME